MGMYTDFCFDAKLKADTPKDVIELLTKWMSDINFEPDQATLPDHPFFASSRWNTVGWCGSTYFDAQPHRSFSRNELLGDYTLNLRCNLKNYSDEIEKFVDWIKPYLDKLPGDFLGFSRYEENDTPDLIYM